MSNSYYVDLVKNLCAAAAIRKQKRRRTAKALEDWLIKQYNRDRVKEEILSYPLWLWDNSSWWCKCRHGLHEHKTIQKEPSFVAVCRGGPLKQFKCPCKAFRPYAYKNEVIQS